MKTIQVNNSGTSLLKNIYNIPAHNSVKLTNKYRTEYTLHTTHSFYSLVTNRKLNILLLINSQLEVIL